MKNILSLVAVSTIMGGCVMVADMYNPEHCYATSASHPSQLCLKHTSHSRLNSEGYGDNNIAEIFKKYDDELHGVLKYEICGAPYARPIRDCRPEDVKIIKATSEKLEAEKKKKAEEEAEKERKRLAWEKERAEEEAKAEAERKALEKKHGMKFCDKYTFYNTKGCMVELGQNRKFLMVSQQIPDGTLVRESFIEMVGYDGCEAMSGMYCEPIFIEKNAKDSRVVDGRLLEGGLFGNIGTYQYTTTFGAQKTVVRIKRLK